MFTQALDVKDEAGEGGGAKGAQGIATGDSATGDSGDIDVKDGLLG